jgi:hypothetical protein
MVTTIVRAHFRPRRRGPHEGGKPMRRTMAMRGLRIMMVVPVIGLGLAAVPASGRPPPRRPCTPACPSTRRSARDPITLMRLAPRTSRSTPPPTGSAPPSPGTPASAPRTRRESTGAHPGPKVRLWWCSRRPRDATARPRTGRCSRPSPRPRQLLRERLHQLPATARCEANSTTEYDCRLPGP